MKRSEMKLELEEIVSRIYQRKGGIQGTIKPVVKAIMNHIEGRGMLPPKKELGDSGFVATTEILDYTELDYNVIWEPEDDKD